MYISLLLHGALAGIAIWHVVEAFDLSNAGDQNFLVQYQRYGISSAPRILLHKIIFSVWQEQLRQYSL